MCIESINCLLYCYDYCVAVIDRGLWLLGFVDWMASSVGYGRVALTVIGGMPGREIGVVTGMPGILGWPMAACTNIQNNMFNVKQGNTG